MGVSNDLPPHISYYEYELNELKPAVKYQVYIHTNDSQKLKSDSISTISVEEEKERDIHMREFEGNRGMVQ